jgi:LysM repeat protein
MSLKWKSIVAFLLSISFLTGSLSSAFADQVADSQIIMPSITATSDKMMIGADDSGQVYYKPLSDSSWHASNLNNSKNGISNLYFFDDTFVATSFFAIYTSKDGINWDSHFAPIGRKFDASNIISDSEFYSAPDMSIRDIQRFLESQSNCTNSLCLAEYSQETKSINGGIYCSNYAGAEKETAATIIYKTSKACHISVEVILTTLQKEQSLLTKDAPSRGELNIAMGFSCPDTGNCNKNYYGFQNQVYNSAKQFQSYVKDFNTFNWIPVGKETSIPFHPANQKCPEGNVTIKNNATAGLYYYTPYQPNAAALYNIGAKGDKCSSYGNLNFWTIYNTLLNKTKDYNVFIVESNKKFYAYDSTGGVSISNDLAEWSYSKPISMPDDLTITGVSTANGYFKASTSDENKFLISKDGINWSVKNMLILNTNTNLILPSLTSYAINITASSASLNGEINVNVDGIDYETVSIDSTNFVNNTISLPAFTLNDGTHYVTLTYQNDALLFADPIEIKATIGSPKETVYHTVTYGDSLQSIAALYGTTVEWINQENQLYITTELKIGQKLKVKYIYNVDMLDSSPIHEEYHTVLPGESINVISTETGVPVSIIKKLNSLTSDVVYVGQQIRFA